MSRKIAAGIAGLVFILVVLEAGIRFVGFVFVSYQEIQNRIATSKKGAYRILCLGDSTTALAGAGGRASYPGQLELLLNSSSLGIPVAVINKGAIGANSMSVLGALENNIEKYKPDLVVTMIGLNDFTMRYYEDADVAHPVLFNRLKIYKLYMLLSKDIFPKSPPEMFKQHGTEPLKHHNMEAPTRMSVLSRTGVGARAERKARGLLKIDPQNDKAYVELCRIYALYYYRYADAAYFLHEAMRINPTNDMAHAWLGYLELNQGRLLDAKNHALKALHLNGQNDFAHIVLGMVRQNRREKESAVGHYEKALALNRKNDFAWSMLGELYRNEMELSLAAGCLEKAIGLNPDNDFAHALLGRIHAIRHERREGASHLRRAESELQLALGLNPYYDRPYIWLGTIYQEHRDYARAETLFKKAVEISPKNYTAYWMLAGLYAETGDLPLAKAYGKKAQGLYCSPIMRENFIQIKAVLDRHKIKWVLMQYPLRSIQPLRDIFSASQGIVFVENDKNFQEALASANTKDYFIDMFAGDFGHCSPKGHRLIAENLARSIRKNIFHQ